MPVLSEGELNLRLILNGEQLAVADTDESGRPYYLLRDFLHSRDTVYMLSVVNGQLAVDVVENPEGEVWNYLELLGPNGEIVHVGLTGTGELITFVAKASRGPWVAGQLYPGNGAYPTPIQDGMVTTMPTQDESAKTGKWRSGCSHSFNTWETKKDYFDGAPIALLCCPCCGFIERLFVPYESIHDEINMQIFA